MKREMRERIVAGATRVLLREGVQGFSMRKLASEIGYTATALYFHFPDKESLLGEVVERRFMAFRQTFERIGRVNDPIERLARMGMGFIEFALAHPDSYRFMFLQSCNSVPRGKLIEKGNPSQDCYAYLLSTVEEALRAKRFRPEYRSAQEVAQVFFGAAHGIMALHLIKGDDDWVAWTPLLPKARVLIESLIRGLTRGAENVPLGNRRSARR